jgi:hypothetical protein
VRITVGDRAQMQRAVHAITWSLREIEWTGAAR